MRDWIMVICIACYCASMKGEEPNSNGHAGTSRTTRIGVCAYGNRHLSGIRGRDRTYL